MADGVEGRVIRYRADIDGLRAVAVLSVMFFHVDSSWVPGGYTGVDIFFVISGFLITRIIGREIERGTFSLRAFYVRRIRRILPVFYTVLVCTMAAGAVLLLPADLLQFLSSLRRALYFTANLYFAKDRGYFDISTDEKPLLHTWSLSIEEQYYFVWPLLLLFLYWAGVRFFGQRKALNQPATIVFTSFLILMGVAYSQYTLLRYPGEIRWYFVLQTRFSELMIGALVAILPVRAWGHCGRSLLTYGGAALVVAALFVLTKESRFPGVNALLPCVGAALLIYSGQVSDVGGASTWLHKVLGLRLVAGVGLISYSMYLWHWPMLAYMRYVYGSYSLPWSWVVGALGATVLLSLFSYGFIERNTKGLKITFRNAFLYIFVTPALVLASSSYGLQRLRPVVPVPVELATYGTDVCHGNFDQHCIRGDAAVAPTVLVTGDSHAAALNQFIDVVGRDEGWSARVLTASSCSPVFGFDVEVLPSWAQAPCQSLETYIRDHYKDYHAVVIASYWAYQLGMTEIASDPHYLQKLVATVRTVAKSVPVYVVSDVRRLSIDPFREQRFSRIGLHVDRVASGKTARANFIIHKAIGGIPNVHWVDLTPELQDFYPGGLYQGIPAYLDEQHLNMRGSAELGKLFVRSGAHLLQPPM